MPLSMPVHPARRPSRTSAPPDVWVAPDTRQAYPLAFGAYRRRREAEERPPARHRGLGREVDRYAWRRWRLVPPPEVEVRLVLRADASPRIRRMVSEILGAIRRGHRPADAISRVSRRFGLRRTRTLACLKAWVSIEFHAESQ